MTVQGLISALIVGLIVGALGRLIIPGKQYLPIWVTIPVGIIAALIGTAIAKASGLATNGFHPIVLLIQIGVAALAVLVMMGLVGQREK